MNEQFLEQFYENVILPRYASEVTFGKISWIDHGKVDLDAWAHHFRSEVGEYVLLYEDSPGSTYLDDGLSHELVGCGEQNSIELRFGDKEQIPNITGWFTLYREKHSPPQQR